MFLPFQIALRSLFSRTSARMRAGIGWIAILGLTLGVAAQSLSLFILDGFEKTLTQAMLGFNGHLVVMLGGEEDSTEVFQSIQDFSSPLGLEAVTPFLYRESLMVNHGKVKGVVFKGIETSEMNRVYQVKVDFFTEADREKFYSGSSKNADEKSLQNVPAVLIGSDLARELGVNAENREVLVLSPTRDMKAVSDSRQFKKFEVMGVFSSGIYEYDSQFAVMSLSALQDFFQARSQILGYEMRLRDDFIHKAARLGKNLEEELPPATQVIAWDELNADTIGLLHLERILFFIILGLIVAVAATNLVGFLVILMTFQSKEISILRALGMPIRQIRLTFMFQGILLALFGIGLGSMLGYFLADLLAYHSFIELSKEWYLVSRIPVSMSWANAGLTAGFGLLLALAVSTVTTRRVRGMELDL